MNDNIRKEIKAYFDETPTVSLPPSKQQQLINRVKLNKVRSKINIAKRICVFAYAICLIFLTIIPIVVLTYKEPTQPPTIYYGNDEAIKKDLELTFAKDYIETNYPQYSFIFDEFTFNSIFGYYIPESDKLLSLEFNAYENQSPYTIVEINLVVSEQFVFNEKDSFVSEAELIKTNDYKMYKTSISNAFIEFLKTYLIYDNYEIFLNFDLINEELLNKFL